MNKTKAARNSGNYSTPVTSTHTDKQSLPDFDRATRYAAYAICGMFAFIIAWMWLTW